MTLKDYITRAVVLLSVVPLLANLLASFPGPCHSFVQLTAACGPGNEATMVW